MSGRVQGVFFRDDCRRLANAAGVAGWVSNRHDGRVEAVFEGQLEAVDRLVSWCRTGPPAALVSGIEVESEEPTGETGFRVV